METFPTFIRGVAEQGVLNKGNIPSLKCNYDVSDEALNERFIFPLQQEPQSSHENFMA